MARGIIGIPGGVIGSPGDDGSFGRGSFNHEAHEGRAELGAKSSAIGLISFYSILTKVSLLFKRVAKR